MKYLHNVPRQNLKRILEYICNAHRILNLHTTEIKSCDTVYSTQLHQIAKPGLMFRRS